MTDANEEPGKIEALDGLRGLAYRETASAEVVTAALSRVMMVSEVSDSLNHRPRLLFDPVEN